MTGLPDEVKRALGIHDAIATDLAHFGGVFRCGTCSAEQPVGDVASRLRSGWPQCCGKTMTWVTRKQLLAETRDVPDGFELVAVESSGWRVETGSACSQPRCGNPCVAAFNRRRRYGHGSVLRTVDAWYRYCIADMYGNWIEDGKVMHWILREVKDGA